MLPEVTYIYGEALCDVRLPTLYGDVRAFASQLQCTALHLDVQAYFIIETQQECPLVECLSVHSIHGPGSTGSTLPHHHEWDTAAEQLWVSGRSCIVLLAGGVRAILHFFSSC